MFVCFSEASVRQWEERTASEMEEFLFQEMLAHDGVVNKIYVINDFVESMENPSIPNVDSLALEGALWEFNSQKSFCSQLPIEVPSLPQGRPCALIPELLAVIARQIQQHFLFELFGFDIVVESGT